MKPFIQKVEKQFVVLSEEEMISCPLIADLRRKTALLLPYKNNAMEFYTVLYRLKFDNEQWIVFGQDLAGYFVWSIAKDTIEYLYQEDETYTMTFCNSTVQTFLHFYHAFTSLLTKRLSDPEHAGFDEWLNTLDQYYRDTDCEAMLEEYFFWPLRLYELSENFYPLSDTKIKFYRLLEEE